MKVVSLVVGGIFLLGSQHVQADMLGLTLNADYANLSLSGRGGDHQFSQPLQFSDDHWQSWSIAFEHPLPLLPNIAVHRQNGNWMGSTLLEGDLRLDEHTFARQNILDQSLDITATDISFYYEVLDNSLLALDLGITAMVFDAELAVAEPASYQRKASGFLPLLYVNLTTQVWGTDTSLFWQGHYTDYRDQKWSKTNVGLAYQFVDFTALTLAVKFGWQQRSLVLTNQDQLDLDFKMSGPFLALEADF
jgi:outer membrane protein